LRAPAVYGGGTVGLMGELARTLVSLSGPDSVHGIIPEALVKYERDPNYTSTHAPTTVTSSIKPATNGDKPSSKGTTAEPTSSPQVYLAVPDEAIYGRTTVVKDMHTRKQMMAQEVLSGGPGSGFVALSGGYGTLEELMETVTWNQLGIHDKGICVLNIAGFWDDILAWIRRAAAEGFLKDGCEDIPVEATTAEEAIAKLGEYVPSKSALKLSWGNE
jgi:uncharacterized protein (TIGR00730 family)